MGTGVVSVLLFELPYNGRWLYWLSVGAFCLNILLFALASVVSFLQYTAWPEMWSTMLHNPNQSLFLGAIPMGLGTIIQMIVLICAPVWGNWVVYTAWGMWMAHAALSVIVAFYLPFILTQQKSDTALSTITALHLFPVIATIFASATGSTVASALSIPAQALATVIASYILWGIGMLAAFMIMTIYFQRLALHKVPPREAIVSVFIPIGPPSLGGFAAMELGRVAMDVFPKTYTIHQSAGVVLYDMGVIVGLVLWGFALLWIFFAVATIFYAKRFPFNMGWWGCTFPSGVFAVSCNKLGQELPSQFFRMVGMITSVFVFLLWALVTGATIRGVVLGRVFDTPGPKALGSDEESCQDSSEGVEDIEKAD